MSVKIRILQEKNAYEESKKRSFVEGKISKDKAIKILLKNCKGGTY
jgi:hypothetical protein